MNLKKSYFSSLVFARFGQKCVICYKSIKEGGYMMLYDFFCLTLHT